MNIVDWIPTIVTAIATVVVALATIYYARTLKETARKTTERPRKEDEINSIIVPLISTCNGEINQLSHKWYNFLKWELLTDKIQKNNYKKIIFNDFIQGRDKLIIKIVEHDKIIRVFAEKYNDFLKTINTVEFRKKVKELQSEYNRNNPDKMFSQEIDGLSNSIILRIIEVAEVNDDRLSDPFEKFWKTYRKYFLKIREFKNIKKYLEEIESLSNQLIDKNKMIVRNLEGILNEYTKEYGVSLGEKLSDIFE